MNQYEWRDDVYRRLRKLITDGDPGIAVFDFDNTCIKGDIGEFFAYFLVETMRYRYDLDAFWELVHPEDGREKLRRITEEALQVAPEDRRQSEAYRRYLAEMAALYVRRLARAGKRDCYQWAVRLHVGLSETQMVKWSRQALKRCLETSVQTRRLHTEDGLSVEIRHGIRPLVEIRELLDVLEASGWEIWIVSATNAWTVKVAAQIYGVPENRVLGTRVEVEDETLTARTQRPVLFREGKRAVIEEVIGERPDLVVGDAVTDYEMLCEAQRMALVIDRGDELLRREGKRRGWAMQPQRRLTIADGGTAP